ncbi:MAG: glycosyltransferase [Bacteroidia bacterium]
MLSEGLKIARGAYLATLDSDDTWEPSFVERSIQILESNQLDFVFSNWMQDNGEKEFVDRFSICKVLEETLKKNTNNTIVLNNSELRDIYLSGCPSPSSSLVFKKDAIASNWSSGLKIADDWCFIMDIVFNKSTKAGFTRDVLWQKNVDGQNIYDGKDMYVVIRDLWIHDQKFLSKRFNNNLSKEEKKKLRENLAHNYLIYSYFQFSQNKKIISGIKYFVLAVLANNKIVFSAFSIMKVKTKNAIKRLKFIQ